jgi:RNA-directed DNA polymerase
VRLPGIVQRAEPCPAPAGDVSEGVDEIGVWERVFQWDSVLRALERVVRNVGWPGIDGMSVVELRPYLGRHWRGIRAVLDEGTYQPKPVLRREMPRPGGGVSLLGVSRVTDRLVQQALAQVLSPLFEPGFSDWSCGLRPGRGALEAVSQALAYINDGYGWVVDIDLEKFFDRVNHDNLMARVARVV